MRKCSYCAMISDAEDVCPWCKRPFDLFVFPAAAIKPAAKSPSPYLKIAKGAAAGLATVIAIWCLAQVRTAPDAARNNEYVMQPNVVAPVTNTPVSIGRPAPALGQNNNFQQPRYEPTFIRDSNPQRTGMPAVTSTPQEAAPHPASAAKLGSVNIRTSNDNDGTETAMGSVLIINDSDQDLSDFQLSIVVNNAATTLVPFEGDINYPMPVTSMRIPPHGRLQVQVGTPNGYGAANIGSRSVQLIAHFADGSSSTDRAQLH